MKWIQEKSCCKYWDPISYLNSKKFWFILHISVWAKPHENPEDDPKLKEEKMEQQMQKKPDAFVMLKIEIFDQISSVHVSRFLEIRSVRYSIQTYQ